MDIVGVDMGGIKFRVEFAGAKIVEKERKW